MTGREFPLIYRNRWDTVTVPDLGRWSPELRVTVVIPAYNCQTTLDLTLASLASQTYPADLMEVVVVDDGSQPPIELPKIAPDNCRIVRAAEFSSGWGRANALHVGAANSAGDILHWLDADMVVFPHHIEAQARWHHAVPYAVVLGYKRFVRDGWITTPQEVAERCAAETVDNLFPAEETEPHDYVEDLIQQSHGLRKTDHLCFRAHVGATASVRRSMYESAGGFNTALRLGEDTEFGFRLLQAGALFVPEPASRSWHLGASHMMTAGDDLRRYNWPHLADHMPHPRWLRHVGGRTWAVPLVTAVVTVDNDSSLELVQTCVDHLLASDEHDLRVLIVGNWGALTDRRRPLLSDPLLELGLIAATYRSEPRVHLIEADPGSVFPSPYRLDVPRTVAVGASTVRRMVEQMDEWGVGLLHVIMANDPSTTVTMWRTSAMSRARHGGVDDRELVATVADIFGERWASGVDLELTDLTKVPTSELRSPPPWRASAPPSVSTTLAPVAQSVPSGMVPVAGLRSLVRATGFVVKLAAKRTYRTVILAAQKVLARTRPPQR